MNRFDLEASVVAVVMAERFTISSVLYLKMCEW